MTFEEYAQEKGVDLTPPVLDFEKNSKWMELNYKLAFFRKVLAAPTRTGSPTMSATAGVPATQGFDKVGPNITWREKNDAEAKIPQIEAKIAVLRKNIEAEHQTNLNDHGMTVEGLKKEYEEQE